MVNFSLEGKVALVTGASYGIGFSMRLRSLKPVLLSCLTISNRNWWIRVSLPMKLKVSKLTVMFAT